MTSLAEVYSQKKTLPKALDAVNNIILNIAECSKNVEIQEEEAVDVETAQQRRFVRRRR